MTGGMPQLIAGVACSLAVAISSASPGASIMLFNASQPCLGITSSPLPSVGGSLVLDEFEANTINSLITAVGGSITGPFANTDSVDGGDESLHRQVIDGPSSSIAGASTPFRFGPQQAERTSVAGVVLTVGRPNSSGTFRDWGDDGRLLGKIKTHMVNSLRDGPGAQAHFFGIMNDQGIGRFMISSNQRGFEVDHVQFAHGFSVVPVPPAFLMGAAGLAGAAIWRRRALRGLRK